MKVTDFGIARAGASDGLTQTGSVMGTATYFSPEQAQGLAVDGRSDVYSLGVVLYEMVHGRRAVHRRLAGRGRVQARARRRRSRRRSATPTFPPDLEQIILTALAKDPDHRYQTRRRPARRPPALPAGPAARRPRRSPRSSPKCRPATVAATRRRAPRRDGRESADPGRSDVRLRRARRAGSAIPRRTRCSPARARRCSSAASSSRR